MMNETMDRRSVSRTAYEALGLMCRGHFGQTVAGALSMLEPSSTVAVPPARHCPAAGSGTSEKNVPSQGGVAFGSDNDGA